MELRGHSTIRLIADIYGRVLPTVLGRPYRRSMARGERPA
jgi:hypothetical protein